MGSASPAVVCAFRCGDLVEVWWCGAWRAAVVLSAGRGAVAVRHCTGGDAGTSVDTVPLDRVRPTVGGGSPAVGVPRPCGRLGCRTGPGPVPTGMGEVMA